MKMLATLLGAVTAIALLSGCSTYRYDRYAYGWGYDGRYTTYNQSYWNAHGCWLDSANTPHCVR